MYFKQQTANQSSKGRGEGGEIVTVTTETLGGSRRRGSGRTRPTSFCLLNEGTDVVEIMLANNSKTSKTTEGEKDLDRIVQQSGKAGDMQTTNLFFSFFDVFLPVLYSVSKPFYFYLSRPSLFQTETSFLGGLAGRNKSGTNVDFSGSSLVSVFLFVLFL